jgi:hypothetical protein
MFGFQRTSPSSFRAKTLCFAGSGVSPARVEPWQPEMALPSLWFGFLSSFRLAASPPHRETNRKFHLARAAPGPRPGAARINCRRSPASPPLRISRPPDLARSSSPGAAFVAAAVPPPSAHSRNPIRSAPRSPRPPNRFPLRTAASAAVAPRSRGCAGFASPASGAHRILFNQAIDQPESRVITVSLNR